MRKSILYTCGACGIAALGAGALVAAPTCFETDDGRWEMSVPAGETHAMTAADVAAIGERDLVKSGEGTLVAGAEMAAFAHDIYVTNGVYAVAKQGGLGSVAAVTRTYVSNAGTLESRVSVYGGWDLVPSLGTNEHVYVEGMGFEGRGALVCSQGTHCLAHKLVFTGDTRIAVAKGRQVDLRQYPVDMGGHKIEIKGEKTALFRFVANGASNPGDVDVDGVLGFEGGAGNRTGHTVLVREGGGIAFGSSMSAWLNDELVFEPGTRVEVPDHGSAITLGKVANPNLWAGPVVVQGANRMQIAPGKGVTLGGFVSGAGGFSGDQGGWLQLACATNAFQGGVAMTSPADLAGPTGGVAVVANGAVPVDGGPVVIGNSSLWLGSADRYDLPAVEVRGAGRVDAHGGVVKGGGTADARMLATNTVLKSLVKTDAGTLDLVGSVRVLGKTEIDGGTLRIASRVPSAEAGLDSWHALLNGGSVWHSDVPSGVSWTYSGLCPEGVAAAYHSWPYNGTGKENDPSYRQCYYYKGYVRIPGETGGTARCNFISSLCRNVRVDIAGKTVVWGDDNVNKIAGGGNAQDWKRLYMNPPVDLPSGWQKIFVYCGNYYNGTCGPVGNTELGWTGNFGIGVDWQARCTTNSANYAKLVDPGDGSFLRRSLAEKGEIDPAPYRATFEGPVAFGSGAALDVGDAQPYTPVVLPSLAGLPTIRNGAVKVKSSVWTIRKSDLFDGDGRPRALPLTLEGDATLAFPDGQIAIGMDEADVAELAEMGGKASCPILSASDADLFPASRFTLPSALAEKDWRVQREGDVLCLNHVVGLVLIFR